MYISLLLTEGFPSSRLMRRLLPLWLLMRCWTRPKFYLFVAVLLLVLIVGKMTSFRHCVDYVPVYMRSLGYSLDSRHSYPMCIFCKRIVLHLSCYEAMMYFPDFHCTCNCASFTQSSKTDFKDLTILFLSTYERYTTQMLRIEFDYYNAASNDPHIKAYLWGEGFPGYNSELSFRRNLLNKYPGIKFDIIFIQTPPKYRFSDKVYIGLKEMRDDGTVVIFRFHECRYGICEPHILDTGASIALFAYARDIHLYPHLTGDVLMVHLPHVIHAPLFNNVSHLSPKRTTTVLLTGRLASAYPFRMKLYNLIESGKIKGAKARRHPTYTMAEGKVSSVKRIEGQVKDYIRSLESAQIVFVTASRAQLRLIKYGETAAAGALIVGDIPLGSEYEFKNIMVEIKPDYSDSKIVETVQYYLSHPEEREQIVSRARRLFLGKYTTRHFFEWLQDVVTLHRHGAKGVYYPSYYIPQSDIPSQTCVLYYTSEAIYEITNLLKYIGS